MRGKSPTGEKRAPQDLFCLHKKSFEFQASIAPKDVICELSNSTNCRSMLFQASIAPRDNICELQGSMGCPGIHQHHGISCSGVALGWVGSYRCFRHSVLPLLWARVVLWWILLGFIAKQATLFCNANILLFSSRRTVQCGVPLRFSGRIMLQRVDTFHFGSWLRCCIVKGMLDFLSGGVPSLVCFYAR